ncbi:inorganic diphosphatase [Anaerosalibacter massiliensis]|uniref:Inorganic pyrophosphatase n=1 Tax=Anaerosalibacter massiliensis TaxID=1347392 RepID=A0A9X2S7E1_9FIRM|nr:inorganic diphosphatase [Anaerosalibacter massiliensis]MCR2044657.1 inorganic diphosphatase [Anaerosalibacter massiliensis]
MNKIVEAFIEIPKGSSNKYEYDLERKVFVLDRALFSPMYYPADYGFVPYTLAEDGDPLDIMVIMSNPTFPGCLIESRVIGMFLMEDEKGKDEKIISVPVSDPRYEDIQTIENMGAHLKKEFEHFFSEYKQLEGKEVHVKGWAGVEEALKAIETSKENFKNKNL